MITRLLVLLALSAGLSLHAADEFEVNKFPIKASKKMPEAGTPEARAIDFLQSLRANGYDSAKEYISTDIEDKDRKSWKSFTRNSKKTGATLYTWHIYKVRDGLPIVSLTYKYDAGKKGTLAFAMKKENGKWMVAGY